jgi:DNA-binding LacI/PurR family transcriptional regulator
MANVRLKDIAHAAGVDVSTVSTILAGKPKAAHFSEATRHRVHEVARRLNYQPNAAARALSTRRTGNVGLTLHSGTPHGWANLYFAGQLVGVEEVCRARGYGLHINLYDLNNPERFVFPKHVQQRAVDGVILAGHVRGGIIQQFRNFGVPVICLGENHDVSEDVPIVCVDHVAKALEAVRYAATKGHRRIGYCTLPTRQKAAVAELVQDAVADDPSLAGIDLRVFVQASHGDTIKSGRELLDNIWALTPPERPSVIIFTTLDVPIGVLREMRVRGLRCPEDLSLIADNNDEELCSLTQPPLTAMGQDLPLLGRTAANTLIELLEAGTPSRAIAKVPFQPLEIRDSVALVSSP